MVKATFGKGKYFIGDICYALDDKIYDKIWGEQNKYENGCFEIKSLNSKFAVASTYYGDGSYKGSDGNIYGVDAGVIGVVPSTLFGKDKTLDGGKVINVKKELKFIADNGKFTFIIDGEKLVINTK
jgi:hypothetical protein